MNQEDLKNIAQQLSKPEGEAGLQIADMMNTTNFIMTSDCINQLNLREGTAVLEIGHGNCGHLKYLLEKANDLSYTGLEISSLMSEQAKEINSSLLSNKVDFVLYDGVELPFESGNFDTVFTVNTVYFWTKPQDFLKEIYRVLNEKGTLLITMADKSFMEKLPFTKYVFNLYEIGEIEKMANNADFQLKAVKENTDEVRSKVGDLVTRTFYTLTLGKK